MSDENPYETSSFIVDELQRNGIDSQLWYTGGGCTAVLIEVKHHDPAIETAYISITNGNSSVCLRDADVREFRGWMALYFASDDAMTYGEPFEEVHGGEVWKDTRTVKLEWRTDAVVMALAIAEFINDLKG